MSLTYNEPIPTHNKFEGLEVSEEAEHDHPVPETESSWVRVRTRKAKQSATGRSQGELDLRGTPAQVQSHDLAMTCECASCEPVSVKGSSGTLGTDHRLTCVPGMVKPRSRGTGPEKAKRQVATSEKDKLRSRSVLPRVQESNCDRGTTPTVDSRCDGPPRESRIETPKICEVEKLRREVRKELNLLQQEDEEINAVEEGTQEAQPVQFEVTLDSGAHEHVASRIDAPGYKVEPSRGSKKGAFYTAANGGKIENEGQVHLNLQSSGGVHLISVFQVCDIIRPLMSVGSICDKGCTVTFNAKGAVVTHEKSGKELERFQRSGGLYTTIMSLEKPEGFPRQGS